MPLRVHVDVVSAEELIFSGETDFAVFPGEAGELGIERAIAPVQLHLNGLRTLGDTALILGVAVQAELQGGILGLEETIDGQQAGRQRLDLDRNPLGRTRLGAAEHVLDFIGFF